MQLEALIDREEMLTKTILKRAKRGYDDPDLREQLKQVREELRNYGYQKVWTEVDDPNVCPHGQDYEDCPDCRH